MCVWIGMTREQIAGKRLHDLLTVPGRMFYETHFAPLLRMQHSFLEVALDFVGADGKKLPVIANAVERLDDEGRLLFIRIALFKTPERRRYERDLVAARQRVESLNVDLSAQVAEATQTAEFREQFIAVLGHDLRNPVAAIDGGTNLLLRDGWTTRSPMILKLMKASVLRMSGLIDNVMDLARARLGGGIQLQREMTDKLEETLTHVVEEVRFSHPDRIVETSFSIAEKTNVDLPRLAQLFSNLLANAITHGAKDQPIRVEAEVEHGNLEISVVNGGNPIPAEARQHLFQPFYRASGSSTVGLGLGLFIASEIAEAHGAQLLMASDDSETRFTFKMRKASGSSPTNGR
jgi:sigma-B regulation protein RsbU (phosphoserine phosphatase)